LQAQDFSHLDLEHLIAEMERLGKSDKRAISHSLMRLCEHFLQLRYWESERTRCFRAWKLAITNFRLQIQAILRDSPSLRNHLRENFEIEYCNSRKLFLNASELNPNPVPLEPDLDQALDEDWLPWRPE
jgi:hypothetical protein